MFAENLDVFLRDFGVACSKGSVAWTGILDTPDETLSLAGVNVLSTMYQLRMKTSDASAAAIASGDAITVNGQPFIVRDVVLQDDGLFTVLTLSK